MGSQIISSQFRAWAVSIISKVLTPTSHCHQCFEKHSIVVGVYWVFATCESLKIQEKVINQPDFYTLGPIA